MVLGPAYALASAVSWGAGDFCGGLAAKRAQALVVAFSAQALGLVLMLALAVGTGEAVPGAGVLALGGAAGLCGAVGLAALYKGLSVGRMGIVAPVSAVLSAAIPAVVASFVQGVPGAWQLVGFGLGLAGVWLVSRPAESSAAREAGLEYALLAGIGFGGLLTLMGFAGSSGVFWPLTAARAAGLVLMGVLVLATRSGVAGMRSAAWLALGAGLLDVGGNVLYVLATRAGRLDVAAVLSSLYPAATVILARLLLGERLSRAQDAGLVLALVAIPLIAGAF